MAVNPSATTNDRYPLMTLEYALDALRIRFGAGNVSRVEAKVCIKVERPGGLVRLLLTPEQAKYLVARPIGVSDLVDRKFPKDWP